MDDIKIHTLCLNMIVKNEAHVIENVLECVSKYIDYYIISDTGSTDETKQVIKKYFDKLNISGEIYDDKWVNFGYNRTKALEYCVGKCEYCWVIDADDIIIGNLPMPAKLTKDSYKVIYGKDFSYRRNQIFKVDRIWKYVGVLHEYATSENNKNNTVATIEGDYYIDSRRLGNRNKDKNKYKKDIEILLRGAEDEPDNERYIFYLAQSYMDDGQLENSNKYYLQRFNMGGWVEEQYYSLLKIGINNIKLRKNKKIIIDSLLEAFNFRPSRLEALYELVNYLFYNERDKDVKSAAKYAKLGLHIYSTTDTLFVTKSIYEYRFLDITYLVLFYNNEFGEAYKSINNLLNRQKYPENQNIRLQKNRGFAIPKIMDNIIKYPKEKILFLTENIKNKLEIKVLFTITTCKRLDLFINTIHSFINCCEDIDLIDKFICIDDNSSIRERNEMKQKYPFFDFIFKSSYEKGHINSMNKILDCITIYNPKYIIHLEDDWNFYAKKCYITDSIKIIENTKNIKQVLFNKNYAELYDEKSLNLAGGIRKHIDGLFYIEHEHYKENTQELKDFYDRNKGSSSSAYWPHFSFRPSLICCDIFKKIGKYRSNNGHFEMDYANRFVNSGYKSAFFDSLSCYHTGKLTSENNSDKPNAYKLNNVVQFTAKQNKSKVKGEQYNIKIVNLKRRDDRKKTMIDKLNKQNITKYNFIEAVDGCDLKPTYELEKLFRDNDFGSRIGVIGCALSHFNLWKQLVNDENNNYYIILEYDITFCRNFKIKLDKLKNKMEEKEYLLLGYSMFEKIRSKMKDMYDSESKDTETKNLNKTLYMGGTFGYSINKIGAKKMIKYIKTNGIKHGIDYLNKIIDIDCWECNPCLVFSEWAENRKQIDSDIQYCHDSLDFSLIRKNLDNFFFIRNADIFGNDIKFEKKSPYEMANIAIRDENCIGFNTLGFFKNDIKLLENSKYFGENDGIYIKKEIYEKNMQLLFNSSMTNKKNIRIKMMSVSIDSEKLCKEWNIMCEGHYRWKNIEITSENHNIDYYVIINKPRKDDIYIPEKTILFQIEPWVRDNNKNWGVKTWGEWSEPDESKFLYVGTHKKSLNNVQWWVTLPLIFPKIRSNRVVSILSYKEWDIGHQLRINISKKSKYIDVFGRDNYHKLNNYLGKLKDDKKESEYVKYKYCLVIENNYEHNYASEKIWDGILCECLCFYWGCPNLSDHIDPNCYVRLDENDIDKSLQIIHNTIQNNLWEQKIEIIKKEKLKIIEELGFFPRINKIINKDRL